MAQVIIYSNFNGGVSMCIPTGELPIEQVLVKDCPDHSIIVDDSELPESHEFFDAWELVDGKVVINETKKQVIVNERQAQVNNKQTALNKLMALGLTEQEALALGVK